MLVTERETRVVNRRLALIRHAGVAGKDMAGRRVMSDPNRPTAAGGCLIALAIIAGVVVGAATHEPTIGILAGIAIGIAASVAVWLRDRR
jgi:hypothetical protein